MPTTHFASSSDLPTWAVVLACILAAASLAMLLVEMRRRERGGAAIVLTGLLAVGMLLVAVLRPVKIAARESVVGARVVVLSDTSRSMALPGDGAKLRREARDAAIAALGKSASDARLLVLGFGEGAARPLPASGDPAASARAARSDLSAALRALASAPDERPAAVVVVSDGRLDDPPEDATTDALKTLGDVLHVPVHTIGTTRAIPADASVRRVAAAGAAVAHVPMPLRVEIGCTGGLACDELTVTARELRDDGPPALLASGLAHLKDGRGTLDLTVTLERAGARILEIAITPPGGDTIPENDRRLVAFNVARERVRVLHVAGRPTNDVRALRQWLKSDASVDVVAFFILRTPADNPMATQEDLALIPFPVDELFSEHLPSFDAVVLQDFDAQPYGLERHLPALARYVKTGGGLIMVGGPNSFVAGGYSGTDLGKVLPVELDGSSGATAADTASFVPSWTEQGRAAPLLGPLRAVTSEELPSMPGANVLGDVRPGGVVLWTHPTRVTKGGAPMPVLAISDQGDGRSIALGVDGGWLLEFSPLGARTAGRGHGALWDGLLGWLMRDPRFEPAQVEVVGGCTAGLASTLRVRVLPAPPNAKPETIALDVSQIDRGQGDKTPSAPPIHLEAKRPTGADTTVDLPLPARNAGGYTARLRIGNGPTTRRDFACEAGGDEWADPRPDGDRLRALASATGGTFAWADDAAMAIPLPKPTVVSAERHVVPVAPPWTWALLAAVALGAHWFTRRRSGLS
jgi:uncharacterized membrane protein